MRQGKDFSRPCAHGGLPHISTYNLACLPAVWRCTQVERATANQAQQKKNLPDSHARRHATTHPMARPTYKQLCDKSRLIGWMGGAAKIMFAAQLCRQSQAPRRRQTRTRCPQTGPSVANAYRAAGACATPHYPGNVHTSLPRYPGKCAHLITQKMRSLPGKSPGKCEHVMQSLPGKCAHLITQMG